MIDETGASQMLDPRASPEEDDRHQGDRGHHRDDGPDPGEDGVQGRCRGVGEPHEQNLVARGLRSGRGHQGVDLGDQAGPRRVCAIPRSRSAPTCSPARPASARPKPQSSSPRRSGVEMLRFDMSEYMERHTISRLIGAPPGYVGFDQGGLLTDGIDQHPHCVLLLDEIEKAHPDLFNILLQVMDHGKLTDHNGKQVDFRNVIIIMTTNAGASDLARNGLRLHQQQARGRRYRGDQQAVRAGIPEPARFRSSRSAACRRRSWPRWWTSSSSSSRRSSRISNVVIELSDEARDWLCEHGYDEAMGARPMARLIQATIKTPLADEVLFGQASRTAGPFASWCRRAMSGKDRRSASSSRRGR